MSDKRKQPVERLSDGNVKAAIWENEGEKGIYHSASFARTYRKQDGTVAETHGFSGTDLLKLSELSRQSYEKIRELRSQNRNQTQGQNYADQQRKNAQNTPQRDPKGMER